MTLAYSEQSETLSVADWRQTLNQRSQTGSRLLILRIILARCFVSGARLLLLTELNLELINMVVVPADLLQSSPKQKK